MTFPISRREVLQNIVRFRDCVSEHPGAKTYRGLMNRATGDLKFAQPIDSIGQDWLHRKKTDIQWEPIEISMSEESGKLHFELEGVHQNLGMLAKRVVDETLNALNQLAHYSSGHRIEVDLSRLQLAMGGGIEALPGWKGALDRIQAEERLKGAPAGTYLLRESDDETEEMIRLLAESNRMRLRGFLATVTEPDEKISDVLILQSERGWAVLTDDPDLSDYRFVSSAQQLIALLAPRFLIPI